MRLIVSFGFRLILLFLLLSSFKATDFYSMEQSLAETPILFSDTLGFYMALDTCKALVDSKQFERATHKLDSLEKVCLNFFGEKSGQLGDIYHHRGRIYFAMGQYQKCIEITSNAIRQKKLGYGENNLSIADSYLNVGSSFFSLRQCDSATVYDRLALEVFNVIYKDQPDHPDFGFVSFNLGDTYLCSFNFQKAIEFYSKAQENWKKSYPVNHSRFIHINNRFGEIHLKQAEYHIALNYYNRALAIAQNQNAKTNSFVSECRVNIGLCYKEMGRFEKALSEYHSALDILNLIDTIENNDKASIYRAIGGIHYLREEYKKAEQFHRRDLDVKQKNNPSGVDVALALRNLGSSLLSQERINEAIDLYNEAFLILNQNYENNKINIARLYNSLGIAHFGINQTNRADEYYKKSIGIFSEVLGENDPKNAMCYLNWGLSYEDKKEFREAILKYEKAYRIVESLPYVHPYYARICKFIGRCYEEIGNFKIAHEYYEKALRKTVGYRIGDYSKISDINQFADLLNHKASCLESWYNIDEESNKLYQAYKLSEQALGLLENRFKRMGEADRNALTERIKETLDTKIRINQSLYYLTDSTYYKNRSFEYAEKGKALNLYQAIHEAEVVNFTGVPAQIISQKDSLLQELTMVNIQRQELYDEGVDNLDSIILTLSKKEFLLKDKYDQLLQSMEEDYPNYYRAKFTLPIVTIENIQERLLEPNQTLLEYFVGKDSIYIFLIKKEVYQVFSVYLDFSLEGEVSKLLNKGITKKFGAVEEQSIISYTEAALRLYKTLIKPVETRIDSNLIIIPDGALGYIPFETLLSYLPQRLDRLKLYPFLIKKYQFSYSYSATLLDEIQNQKAKNRKNQLLAFAPFAVKESKLSIENKRDKLLPLEYSGEECKAVTNLIGGNAFYGDMASLKRFKEMATGAKILHISTHGQANSDYKDAAYLAFSYPDSANIFDKLYARDLYSYSIDANMVVLSACETNLGRIQKGEGVLSLARAFTYAGAKSIFSTLWKVSDEKTKNLVVAFYRNLKLGMNKSQALHKAKSDFINNSSGQFQHPYFWAGMIGIGDMSAIY